MKAAVLEKFESPLVVQDVPDPRPGPGEVIIRTRAAGVCRTDLKLIDGAVPTLVPPRILGHELAGEVWATGAGVSGVGEGDRVLVSLDVSCGKCSYCRVGELDHCANLRRLGIERDGALAEFVQVPAANLIPLPDGLDFIDAAVIPDAVGSPYHALLRKADVRPAQTVAVYGLGGLGLTAVQIARLAGASVIGIARTPQRRALAAELGCTWTVDPDAGPLSTQIRDLTGGHGVDSFLDFVGIEGSVEQAVLSCRKGGTVVVVGYSIPTLVAPMMRLVYDEVTIRGSRGSTRADLYESVDLVSRGMIRPVIGERLPLTEVNGALDRLRAGSVIGRPVVEFAG